MTIDMPAAYIRAITNASRQALPIFDRFHVQRLAYNALDELPGASTQNKAELKNTR